MGEHTDGTARRGLWRTRWAAVGAAVAVVAGAGGIGFAHAAGEQPVSVAVAPCRLFDTRAGGDNVGAKSTPLGEGDANVMTVQVTGGSGRCLLPVDATSVRLNITVVSPTASSFLTVFPADGTRPGASALNWSAGQAPTSNFAETTLSADGKIKLFNRFGTVQVLADVTGYTVGHYPNQLTNNQVAQGRWEQDPGRELLTSAQTLGPPAFDGRNLWLTQTGFNGTFTGRRLQVVSMDPGTAVLGTPITLDEASITTSFTVADTLFDGRSVWIAYSALDVGLPGSLTVSRLVQFDTVTRTVTRRVVLPSAPTRMGFDGTNIWTGTSGGVPVIRVNATTGTVLLPNLNFNSGVGDMVFDGSKMWISGTAIRTVSGTPTAVNVTFAVDPVTGTAGSETQAPNGSARLAFDGTTVWASNGTTTVTFFNPLTGGTSGSITSPTAVTAMAFDGKNMWLRTSSGAVIVDLPTMEFTSSFYASGAGSDITFDGTAMWTSTPMRRLRVR